MQAERGRSREPVLNLPAAVTFLVVLLFAVHAAFLYVPDWLGLAIYDRLAFVPARFTYLFDPDAVLEHIAMTDRLSPFEQSRIAQALNGGPAAYLTPLTYTLLHGDWTHLTMNELTLAAFGSPVAKRLGGGLFLLFMALCAIAGAMTHLLLHMFDISPVVGASAAISGTMAAIARFAFGPGSNLSEERNAGSAIFDSRAPLIPLAKMASNRQTASFVTLWLGLNFLLGVFPQAIGVSGVIAWEAHVGGFMFGLLSFGLFDRAARRAR